uniref:Uncharacterized protein n=1 Tax=Globodera rostochiensis TaxID=31243 RepID=A0A914HKB3_GLORO
MERFQLDPFPSSSTDGRLGSAMAKGRAKGTKQQMISVLSYFCSIVFHYSHHHNNNKWLEQRHCKWQLSRPGHIEKITQRLFGEKKERFVYMQALVFCQCATNLLVAWYVLRRNARKSLDNVPNYLYSMCSTSYFLAMLFSSLALEWVNYPTQVLGKSCKPIPIMLFGVLFAHKRSVVASCFYACHWQWTESPELSKIESDIITPLTNGR